MVIDVTIPAVCDVVAEETEQMLMRTSQEEDKENVI